MSTPSSDNKNTPKRTGRIAKGRRHEEQAARFYEQQGFEILERNWQASHKEIDLIVKKDDLIAFVEVKAATTDSFGHPSTWIDARKKDNLIHAASQYVSEHDVSGCDLRFDAVTFVKGELEHYPDAFTAD
jgi:putative endonuclease